MPGTHLNWSKLKYLLYCCTTCIKTESNASLIEVWYNNYLKAKNIYRAEIDRAKKVSNARLINEANNPVKAAWKLINDSYKMRPVMECKHSPDDVNDFFISTVAELVESISISTVDPTVLMPPAHF